MERYTFSSEQLEQYFDRIALAKEDRINNVASLDNETQLRYLSILQKHHIIRIPFENLVQHYSWHRVINTHPLRLHRKIVQSKARGGYCLETNTLFHNILRSLGFHCYLAAGRVWVPPEGKWTGWSHVVNLVIIGDTKFLCDVGFGPRETTMPMPLVSGTTRPQIPPAESRLVHERLPETLTDQKAWIYQYREAEDAEWIPAYCFTETELLPDDLEGLNYAPWIGRASHFTQKVICVRFSTENEHGDGGLPESEHIAASKISGAMILNQDNFKWRANGENSHEERLTMESERIEVLRRWFGIELDEEDRSAIAGTVSALRMK